LKKSLLPVMQLADEVSNYDHTPTLAQKIEYQLTNGGLNYSVILVKSNSVTVGAAIISKPKTTDDPSIELFVKPSERRNGIASEILRLIKSRFDNKCFRIWNHGTSSSGQRFASAIGLTNHQFLELLELSPQLHRPMSFPDRYIFSSLSDFSNPLQLNALIKTCFPLDSTKTITEEPWFNPNLVSVAQEHTLESLIAFAVGKTSTYKNQSALEIHLLGTLPIERGKGIATKVVAKLIELSHSSNFNYIFTYAEKSNKAALNAYSRNGFAPKAAESVYLMWNK
jgi:mycothiol synthase